MVLSPELEENAVNSAPTRQLMTANGGLVTGAPAPRRVAEDTEALALIRRNQSAARIADLDARQGYRPRVTRTAGLAALAAAADPGRGRPADPLPTSHRLTAGV